MNRKSRTTFGLCICLALFCLSPVAMANDFDGTARTGLMLSLLDHEASPSQAQLASFESQLDVPAELIAFALDESASSALRGRAVRALGFYPNAKNERLVLELLRSLPPEQNYLRVSALITLNQAFELHDASLRLETLTELSLDDSSAIRELAVQGLGLLRRESSIRPQVDDHLLQLLIAERNDAVAEALSLALRESPELTPTRLAPLRPVQR